MRKRKLSGPKGIEVGVVYKTSTKAPEEYVVEEIQSSRLHLGGIRIRYLIGGYEQFYDARALRRGNIRSPFQRSVFGVGYLGVGNFEAANKDGSKTLAYGRWMAMLSRCYNKIPHGRDNSYKVCTVCDEWLNFQNFAMWFCNQRFYGQGHDIDKDLLVPGNKEYSPTTCCLLPPLINSAITGKGAIQNGLPCGVHWHKKNGCFVAKVGKYNDPKTKYLGSFQRKEDAWAVVKADKESYVKELAESYKDRLDSHVYGALLKFEAKPYYEDNT